MKLESRFLEIQALLKELLPFISAWDIEVIKGDRFEHSWLDQVQSFSDSDKYQFDGARDFSVLKDKNWLKTIKTINSLTSFKKSPYVENNLQIIGKKKKQHELKHLFSLLEEDRNKSVVDFGGGVGNLAYFLEKNLDMKVNVLEKDHDLIETGIKRLKRLKSNIGFTKVEIQNPPFKIDALEKSELAIGLHTCGNFANNMFRSCIKNKNPYLINFGCCYSKIKDNDYHLSSLSHKELKFNYRALSAATLGFSKVPKEMYDYRLKIMNYKFSFYHWLYDNHELTEFCSMSNARRSLYKNDFPTFFKINLKKFFPDVECGSAQDLSSFYHSAKNSELNNYFSAYYSISRYIGQLLEAYILCDRALFLQENNYDCEIREVFTPHISPRNKAIIAKRSVAVS